MNHNRARAWAAVCILSLLPLAVRAVSAATPHVVVVGGDAEYGSRTTTSKIADRLEKDFGFRTTLIHSYVGALEGTSNSDKSIPGLEAIKDADLLIIYVRMRIPPKEQLDLLDAYFQSGKPAIGMRTTTHGFTNDRGWCPRYFGGHYWSHFGDGIELFTLPDRDEHPILRGVPRHATQSANGVYMTNPLGDNATPLVLAKRSDDTPAETYAWTNEYKPGSRQFFFTAGHPEEFEEPHNAALLYNAVFWCLGREVPVGGILEQSPDTKRQRLATKAHPAPPKIAAPSGAKVLFDGGDLAKWDWWFGGKEPRVFDLDGRAHSGAGLPDFPGARWKVRNGSAVATAGFGDIVTRDEFTDYQLHLDFLIPASPSDVKRHWRGNSGVYLHGRYEIQLLNSHQEDEVDKFSCGAITGQRPPSEQACAAPGTWQSLDVYFSAPRYQNGRQRTPARATVVLNGQTIHDNVPLPKRSAWGFRTRTDNGALTGPIRLEADTSPVEFANIWLRELDAAEVSERLPHRRPLTGKPWIDMDYGPFLTASIEVAPDDIANKGIAIRVDEGDGGVSAGHAFQLFETDTLRMAAGWLGQCTDWRGIVFNGEHESHPSLAGHVLFSNSEGPGWARPGSADFDDQRLEGRDGKHYGPLDREWAHWKGLYRSGNNVVLSYTVGDAKVLEMPSSQAMSEMPLFTRTFQVGPRSQDLILQVAHDGQESIQIHVNEAGETEGLPLVTFLSPTQSQKTRDRDDDEEEDWDEDEENESFEDDEPVDEEEEEVSEFDEDVVEPDSLDGLNYENESVAISKSNDFEMCDVDYTIFARIRTEEGGSIFSKAPRDGRWAENGKTLFVTDGHLAFDIGWVGVVHSEREIADGDWHDVAMTFDHDAGKVRLYIDGKLDAEAELAPAGPVEDHQVRIGFTCPDFPDNGPAFVGQIENIGFYARGLSDDEISAIVKRDVNRDGLVAWWREFDHEQDRLVDATQSGHDGRLEDVEIWEGEEGEEEDDFEEEEDYEDEGSAATGPWSEARYTVCGVAHAREGLQWSTDTGGNLRLVLPAGDQPIRFVLAFSKTAQPEQLDDFGEALESIAEPVDLQTFCNGGPSLWKQELTTTYQPLASQDGPLAIEELTLPLENPFRSWMRLGGFDFFEDGDRAAVCTWQGDVWLVSGVAGEGPLKWRRIAAGMFQPLGLKIVDGDIYVTCRDQITILRDLNGDQEIDFYENFNNDAQVTEHFHEFAVALQTDSEGNFYYCKCGRHAREALVPHHGTLLKVSKDGGTTEIVANGFRAPNGLLVNNDGTFIVSDQEGHWTPKNRINLVRPGEFYGYVMGYHDGKTWKDAAPPITWIHNDFDRSPAEQVRVTSPNWGPLQGKLLNLSYGTGRIHLVLEETVGQLTQGGVIRLPLADMPTGVMRGRFHSNGQLYVCGLFGWSSDKTAPGGFYRIRYNAGKELNLPLELSVRPTSIELTFSDPLDSESATNARNYTAARWEYRATPDYGSEDYSISRRRRRGRDRLRVEAATLSPDGKTVTLRIRDIRPAMQMEVKYRIQAADGSELSQTVHHTIHTLGGESTARR